MIGKAFNFVMPAHGWNHFERKSRIAWLGTHPLPEPARDSSQILTQCLSLGFDEHKRRRLEAADFALFTALWWPDTPSLEQAEILAYLVIWLFTWDDEIDEPTGSYTDDETKAQTYRTHTSHFVGTCLGLAPASEPTPVLSNRIVESFDVIGSALAASYNTDQRQRFFDEIVRFMAASEVEQICRLQDRIFTLREYWSVRVGTSAVYIGSAAGEFSMSSGSPLPLEVMRSSEMQALWDETNIIISITNDLLSLRKEMKLGCIDSIIPLTFALTQDIQTAVDQSVAALKASKERFDEAARKLLSDDNSCFKATPEIKSRLAEFIQVQRSNCVGNLIWR